MRPNLPCFNFQMVPYIKIRQKALKSLIFAEANSENHMSIEQACCDYEVRKDRWLVVNVYKLSITVKYKDKPGDV